MPSLGRGWAFFCFGEVFFVSTIGGRGAINVVGFILSGSQLVSFRFRLLFITILIVMFGDSAKVTSGVTFGRTVGEWAPFAVDWNDVLSEVNGGSEIMRGFFRNVNFFEQVTIFVF